jgi:hypothetical protein
MHISFHILHILFHILHIHRHILHMSGIFCIYMQNIGRLSICLVSIGFNENSVQLINCKPSANWELLILLMKTRFSLEYLHYLCFTYDLLRLLMMTLQKKKTAYCTYEEQGFKPCTSRTTAFRLTNQTASPSTMLVALVIN